MCERDLSPKISQVENFSMRLRFAAMSLQANVSSNSIVLAHSLT